MTELVTVRRTAALAAAIAILFPFLLPAALSTSRIGANALGKFTATAWPEADRLFRSDPLWLGGDAAYSVDLGHGRVLWLFGDSFVASKPGETRRESTFVHNSIAIETGYDPAHASMKFYWPIKDGRPSEFVPNAGEVWLWPEDGIRIGKKLLLSFVRVHSENSKNSLGFDLVGWTAFLVENPDAAPSAWVVHRQDLGMIPRGN